MKRILCIVVALVLGSCRREPPSLNLLIVTIDTLRADGLGSYGNPRVLTPNLDRLSRRSAMCLEAMAQIPITNPSHCCIFTGLYPQNHGAANFTYRIHPDALTLAGMARQHGYQTAAFISGFSLISKVSGLEKDFDWYDDAWGMEQQTTDRPADQTTAKALNWMAKHADKPFMLWVHYFDPHKPYAPPVNYGRYFQPDYKSGSQAAAPLKLQTWDGNSGPSGTPAPTGMPGSDGDASAIAANWGLYLGEISFVDRQLGRLLDFLQERSLTASTAVVVTADHGESFSHHYLFRHVDRIYESLLEVPLLFYVPQRTQPHQVTGQFPLIDVTPTLAELLHFHHGSYDGYSRLAELTAGKGLKPRGFIFAQTPGRKAPWSRGELLGVRDERWKLIQYKDRNQSELFDLAADPGETDDHSGREDVTSQRLAQTLQQWSGSFKRPLPPTTQLDDADQEKLKSLGYMQ